MVAIFFWPYCVNVAELSQNQVDTFLLISGRWVEYNDLTSIAFLVN